MSTKQPIEERLYIGNVHYKTTKEDLENLFKGYNLTSVVIPFTTINKNTPKEFKKYLGFAFAQFETKEDADRAMANLSGTVVYKRAISLRKAVPPLDEEGKKAKVEQYRARVAAHAQEKNARLENKKKAESKKNTDESKAPTGKASSDTIFVTNLHYRVGVRDLSHIFSDYKLKWIHVPTTRVQVRDRKGVMRPAVHNKGIAFVKFATPELQKKALEDFNGFPVYGRRIIVDVAVDARGRKKKEEEKEEEKNE